MLLSQTVEFHYGKHHAGYVAKLNAAAEKDASLAQTSLDDLVLKASGVTFNLAAQIWNHTFYWNCLSPNGGGEPKGKIAELINDTRQSVLVRFGTSSRRSRCS